MVGGVASENSAAYPADCGWGGGVGSTHGTFLRKTPAWNPAPLFPWTQPDPAPTAWLPGLSSWVSEQNGAGEPAWELG